MVLFQSLQRLLSTTRIFDFLAPLALRLYLAPVFWMVGTSKLADIESTAAWSCKADNWNNMAAQ